LNHHDPMGPVVTCKVDIDMADQYLTGACSAATLNPSIASCIQRNPPPPSRAETLQGDTDVSIEFIGMIQTRKVSETLEGLVEAEPDVLT